MTITASALLAALCLPPESRVDCRVPKTKLSDYGAPTAADRRAIQDGVDGVQWVAVLKPSTIAVPDAPGFAEASVLSVRLRASAVTTAARRERLTELLHRAIPYPVVLVTEVVALPANDHHPEDTPPERVGLSIAFKRPAENAPDRIVLASPPLGVEWVAGPRPSPDADRLDSAFLEALALPNLPRQSLLALYQGLALRIEALLAARITGDFSLAPDAAAAQARREALVRHAALVRDIARLRKDAARERQMARRVALNTELQRLEAARIAAAAAL
jgi:hypothetical protein